MLNHKKRLAAAGVALAALVGAAVAGSGAATAATAKRPFVIGYVSTTEGPLALPGAMAGQRAAVAYLNANRGINGHKIVVIECGIDGSPERNQKCANEFANNRSIQMVIVGRNVNSGPFFTALAPSRIPVVQIAGDDPGSFRNANTVDYVGGTPNLAIGLAEMANASKPSTVAFFGLEGSPPLPNYFMARYKGDKSKVNIVTIPAGATDMLPYAIKAGAQSADLVVVGFSGICNSMAKTLAQLGVPGTKVLGVSTCLTPANFAAAPGLFEGWRTAYFVDDPTLGKGVTKGLDVFLDNYPKYSGGVPAGAYTTNAWSAFVTTRDALKFASDKTLYDRKALFQRLYAFKGPVPLGQPRIKCGGYPTVGSTFCTLGSMKVQVKNDKVVRIG